MVNEYNEVVAYFQLFDMINLFKFLREGQHEYTLLR